MPGILYGVGVGPGDPELMTLKACRLIRESEVIALPGPVAEDTIAYKIAVAAVPELAEKTLVPVVMPMVHDKEARDRSHDAAAELFAGYLAEGKNVVYLTLGDPTIYSTYLYVQKRVAAKGFQTELVAGIPSFCAAAARLNVSLCEWEQPLHIYPAVHRLEDPLDLPGNYVLMKSGTKMNQIKTKLRESGRDIYMAEDCGMPTEKLYTDVDSIPDDASYYSLIIAKENK